VSASGAPANAVTLLNAIVVIAAAYLIGSIPMGVLLARLFGWDDPRRHGSGHTGALNVSRRAGNCWPVWLGFRGGMGLATGIGAAAVTAWPALVFAGVALALIRFTVLRHTPRAVIAAALITVPAAWLMRLPPATFALVAGVCALIAARHTVDWNRRYEPAD
jgi:glycerol-3-phosphate acyltransferase PlsY